MISKPVQQPPSKSVAVPANGTAASSAIRLIEVDPDRRYQEPLAVALYGDAFSGKSRFLGTCPSKIGVLPLDRKSRMSVTDAAREFGKHVILPEIDLIRAANPMRINGLPKCCIPPPNTPENVVWKPAAIQEKMQEIGDAITLDGPQPMCCKRHYYRWHVNRVKSVAFRMAERDDVKSICIDPFGAFVQDIEYANYGTEGVISPKEFGFAPRQDMNSEIRDFLNAINHKHLVLTHHSAGVWKDDKPVPGKTKPDSRWGKLPYFVSVVVKLERHDGRAEGEGRYTLRIDDCQANASLIGDVPLSDDAITFANLASLVYPESDPDAWE